MSKTCSLSDFFLFATLDETAVADITAQLEETCVYRRGQVVYNSQTFRRAIGLIVSGSVVVRNDARRVVINRLHAGDLFGVAALFDSENDAYVTEIVADEDTVVQFIPQEQMVRLIREYPAVSEQYIRFLSGRVRFLNRKLAALTVGDTERRVYHYLVSHRDEQGVLRLPDTMTELARALNMGRSSLYRSLDTLISEGILQKEGKTYRIKEELV